MLNAILSMLGLGKWIDSLSEKTQTFLTEGSSAIEARVLLAKLELQESKRLMTQAVISAIACAVIGFVLLLFAGFAMVVQFWDTPYRAMVAWGIVFVLLFVFITLLFCLLRIIRKSKKTFELTLRELKLDWEAIKERL